MRVKTKWRTVICIMAMFTLTPMAYATVQHSEAASDARQPKAIIQNLIDRIQLGLGKAQRGDIADAVAVFDDVRKDANFNRLTPQQRYAVIFMVSACEAQLGHTQLAYDDLLRAHAEAPDMENSFYSQLRLELATQLKKSDAAIDALADLADSDIKHVNGYNIGFVSQTLENAKLLPDGSNLRRRALEALWNAHYQPPAFMSAQGFWFDLFAIYADAGETARATDILTAFDDPNIIIRIRADKRYRPYADPASERFDFQKSTAKFIKQARIDADAHPDQIAGQYSLALDLMNDDQLAEALSVIDAALAKVDSGTKEKPAYIDLNEHLNWAFDTRTRILSLLDRQEEAEATLKKARDASVAGNVDVVSQKINLGDLYYEKGMAKEALEAVKDVKNEQASSFGIMAAQEVRACAYAQLGDKANLETILSYVRAHAKDGYSPMKKALLCADDADGLARLTIAQLDDPLTRNLTLVNFQGYLQGPPVTGYRVRMREVALKVFKRPDVQAAINKYGFIDTYPTHHDGD